MAKESNNFNTSLGALLDGLDGFVSSKTVLGEPITVNDAVILPLVDLKFGIGAGAFNSDKRNDSAGGLGATVSPCAVLVIQNGITKVVNVKSQDPTTKVLDMVPDIINHFTKGKVSDPEVDKAVDGVVNESRKKKKKTEEEQ